MELVCTECLLPVPAGARFCPNCGAKLTAPCPSCGLDVALGDSICPSCGTALDVTAPGQELKIATILFADVAGSTELGEQLGVERLADVLGTFFPAMEEVVESFGGIADFAGDAIVAAFGVPVAREGHADRALGCAQAMAARLDELNRGFEDRFALRLSMRIGINTGQVLISPGRRPNLGTLAGDTLNVAARLQQTANPGQVLVTERTVRASTRSRFEDAGTAVLSGRRQPVHLFRLLATRPGRRGPETSGPMVGRNRELEKLLLRYDHVVRERRPHYVTIAGPAGIGKSRLVAEFLDTITGFEPPPTVVVGRCAAYEEQSTYEPLAAILRSEAGILEDDPPALAIERIGKIGHEVLEAVPDQAQTVAALAWTAGVEDPVTQLRDMSPRHLHSEIRRAWRLFFSGLAADRPLVAVFEDVHWAAPEMLALLGDLAHRVTGPVMFVCPARPQLFERPDWETPLDGTTVSLEPLADSDSDRLVALLLPDEPPVGLGRRIYERAEGNPFFIEEVIRRLVDEGRLTPTADDRRAVDLSDLEIPDTIQSVLAARLDLLPSREKRILQCAAVIGRSFWTLLLSAVAGVDSPELEASLDRLEQRQLVAGRPGSIMEGQREYWFKHVLIRDVAYDTLPLRERTSLHARAAEWIARTSGGRRTEVLDLLAHHAIHAYDGARDDPLTSPERLEELRAMAVGHLLDAAEDAVRKLALTNAKRLASRALDLAARDAEAIRGRVALGEAHFYGYEGDEAWEHLRHAIDLTMTADGEPAEIARLCIRALESPIRWPGGMHTQPAPEVLAHYLDVGFAHAGEGDTAERARLLTLRGLWTHCFPGEPGEQAGRIISADQALAAAQEAAAMAARLGQPEIESAALDAICGTYIARTRYGPARAFIDRRLALAERVTDPWERGDMYAMGGWVYFGAGRFLDAARWAGTGVRQAIDEYPNIAMHCAVWRGLARHRIGDWSGLMDDLALVRRLAGDDPADVPPYTATLFAAAALVHHLRGDEEECDQLLGLLSGMPEIAGARAGSSSSLVQWAPYVAPIFAGRGRTDRALRLLDQGTWRLGARAGILLEARAEVLALTEEWDDLQMVVDEATALAAANGLEAVACTADLYEGVARLNQADPVGAVSSLEAARSGFASLGARWDEARANLELAAARMALGEARAAGQALGEAVPVLRRLGAVTELARAETLSVALGEGSRARP